MHGEVDTDRLGYHALRGSFSFNLKHMLFTNGIEQQAMPIQVLSFLHVHGIHSEKSISQLYQ
jgi:hypothetical protein